VIDGAAVSGIHCRLSRTADGRYWLEDLGSTNGTYVNRVPIAGKVSITRYDYITLGNATPLDEVIARIERLESSGASGHEDS
jgi:pSer/pThr/pTyr-binding forkhead associated (FHA) protein